MSWGSSRELYHLGFCSIVAHNTLSHANEKRDWRIFRDFAEILIKEARRLYTNDQPKDFSFSESIYVIDSTTTELCLNLFPWAILKTVRAAIKLNLGLSLSGNIPSFFDFSSGKTPDVFFLDRIIFELGAYYVFDRGYIDFKRLFSIHQAGAFFVTRAKDNMSFRRLYSHPLDKNTGVRCDQTIALKNYQAKNNYPEYLRRIKFFDKETDRYYVFLTNNFSLDSSAIANLYKHRWQVELFFKWIKQHLSVKTFWGRSENAVKTQICVTMCIFLLVAIMKKKLKIERNSYEILQILSMSMFDKKSLTQLISEFEISEVDEQVEKQARLWDF